MKRSAAGPLGACLVVLAVATAARALPVVRKFPGGAWVTQTGSDFTVPAGQSVEWAVRVCNDTPGPITAAVTDYLHSGECPGHEWLRLDCPPLAVGDGIVATCDDAASPPISVPALDVTDANVPPSDCIDVVFRTAVALLTPVGTSACNVGFYATDAGTPDASGQTSPPTGSGCSCVQVVEPIPTEMELTLEQRVEVQPFVAGDVESTVLYTVQGQNQTPRAAVGRIIVPIPAGLAYVETTACPPGATCSATPAQEFEVANLVVAEDGAFEAAFRVSGNCTGVRETRFCAQGYFEPAEDTSRRILTRDPGAPGESPTCFKPALPDIVVEKSFRFTDLDGSGRPSAGDRIRFLISAWNRGLAPARDAMIIDSLPLGFDRSATGPNAVQTDPTGRYSAGQATWTYGEIGPGTVVRGWLECTMLVDAVAPNRARLSTRVLRDCAVETVLSDNPLTPLLGDPTSVASSSRAVPLVLKSVAWDDTNGDGAASAGEPLRYSILVRNEGTEPALDAALDDTLPGCLADATNVTIIPPDGGVIASTGRQVLVMGLGGPDGLVPDEEVVIEFSTSATDPTLCCNQASVSWTGGDVAALSRDPRGVVAVEPTCLLSPSRVVRFEKGASLLDADGDGAPTPGDRVRYDIRLVADGGELQDLLLTDEMPPGTTLDETSVTVNAPSAPAWSVAPPPDGLNGRGRLHVGPFTLAAGAVADISFEITLEAAAVGTTCNQASLVVPAIEHPRLSDDVASGGPTCFDVLPPSPPALAVVADARGTLVAGCAQPGEDMDLEVTLDALGRVAAEGVLLEVVGLAGLTVIDPDGGVESAGAVTWDLGTVGGGARVTRTLRVQAPCDGGTAPHADVRAVAANAAEVTATGVSLVLAQPLVEGALGATHDDVDSDGVLDPGESLLVEIVLEERGGCAAGPLEVSLALDPVLTLVEVRDGGIANGARADWSLTALDALAGATVSAVVTLDAAAPDCATPSLSSAASWFVSPGTSCPDRASWDGAPVATPPGPCDPRPLSELLREDGVADLAAAGSLMPALLDERGEPDSCVPGTVTRIDPTRVVMLDVAGLLDTGLVLADEGLPVGPGAAGQLVLYEVSASCASIRACKVDADGDPANGRESLRIGTAACVP